MNNNEKMEDELNEGGTIDNGNDTFSEVEIRNYSDLEMSFIESASILRREYLNQLSAYNVSNLPDPIKEYDITEYAQFFSIRKLVNNKKESFLEKLTTVARAASISNSTLVTVILSDSVDTFFWIGSVNKSYDKNMTSILGETLKGSIDGNFHGSEVKKVKNELVRNVFNKLSENYSVVSAISNVASLRNEDGDIDNYVQGIENLIEALRGKKYSVITIADPITNQETSIVQNSLEQLYSQLSGFEKTEMSMNENTSISSSDQYSKSYATAIGKNTSISQSHTTQSGWSESTSVNDSKTKNLGAVAVAIAGVAAVGLTVATGGLAAVAGAAVASTAAAGTAVGTKAAAGIIGSAVLAGAGSAAGGLLGSKTHGEGKASSKSGSESDTQTTINGESEVKTETSTQSNTYSKSLGTGRTLSFSVENKAVKDILDCIDVQIERLKGCASYGSFSACTYVLSEDINVNMVASSLFNALISGEKSNIQVTKVNTWGIGDGEDDKVEQVLSFISKLTHPCFCDYEGKLAFTPASLVSGKELAIQLGFPKKSIQGLSVIYKTPFGRNVLSEKNKIEKKLPIGKIMHMGAVDKSSIVLDLNTLTAHTFITGSTGTGKSNTTYQLLDKITSVDPRIHFMVVEPAKGEYKHAFYNHPRLNGEYEVHVYGTNPKKMDLLRINPFSFPDDIHVLEHIDRLVDILNVCWPMYAAMPAILKNAIIKSYERCGWDTTNSYIPKSQIEYPCFSDVLQCINEILESSAFSNDNKGDYTGALCTRVESLTTGLNGQLFTTCEISAESLFDTNVIVDLSRIGSVETKSLIMGILVMKLQEYRMAVIPEPNQPLRHVTVIEEAHNLLKKTSTEQSSDSSNLVGKSVEMITNAIAEMRTYGEGFFIVDQAPNLLDEAAIRNTNTKIVLRLPEAKDREIVGKAMALSDEQIVELSKLEKGCAVVYQNDWEEAVLCKFEQYHKDQRDSKRDSELFKYNGRRIKTQSEIRKKILRILLDLVIKEDQDEKIDRLSEIDHLLLELNDPYPTKMSIRSIVSTEKKCRIDDISPIVVELYDVKGILKKVKDLPDIEKWNESVICLADPELRKMSKRYMDRFVQCLLIEQSKNNPEFEPYVESWVHRMGEV